MYRALYRKWRPQTFDDVYGQLHVTKTLKTELETGRISHAYLFTGSRGTGKTTCAKILSKAVNCLHPVDGNPCNECEICKGIDNGSIMDVIEIDAASNNSVDNIRDLREEVNYTPANTKYRVYIIDEVHMLSPGAFNALLKTLEEPPSYVIFILATTEIHKLPATILSRCQRFDFKRIASSDIISRLKFVAEKENVQISENAANLIANISDGGMRDALSLMDRCLSITDNIDENTVSTAAGIAGTAHLFEFSDYISKAEFTNALTLVSRLHNEACDIESICTGLCEHFRNLMVAKTVNDCSGLIICSNEELEKYKESAKALSISKILECIDILGSAAASIKNSNNKKIKLEAAVIKMCGINNTEGSSSDFEKRLASLEEKVASLVSGAVKTEAPVTEKKEYNPFFDGPRKETPEEKPVHITHIEDKKEVSPVQVHKLEESEKEEKSAYYITNVYPDGQFNLWPDIVSKTLKYNPPLYSLLVDTNAIIENNKIIIITENSSLSSFLREMSRFEDLKKAIIDVTGGLMKASIRCTQQKQEKEASNPILDAMKSKIKEFNED